MPAVVHWDGRPDARPLLITADLSDAYWPASHRGVAWRPGDIELVLAGIAEIGTVTAPESLPRLADTEPAWPALSQSAEQLAEQGVCSAQWLAAHASALAAAEAACDVSGSALVHGDLRSDNVCIKAGLAVFVDWSNSARGNPELNLASILASLHLEGAPPPFEVMPGGGSWAARDAAGIACRLLEDATMPTWLRDVLRRLLAINLDWAAASFGLPARDGPPWTAL
jgi:hypothetical protein